MRTELKEQSEFIKILKQKGFNAYKVTATKKGVPDIEAFRSRTGIIYKFEVKATGGKLSPQQIQFFKDYPYTFLVVKKNGVFHIGAYNIANIPFNHRRVVLDSELLKEYL